MSGKSSELKNFFKNLGDLFGIDDFEDKTLDEMYEICKKLKNERDRYYHAMDNCADSFHITDKKGKIIFVNKAFEKKTKVNRDYILGKNVSDMEKKGFYKPSAPRLALKEKRSLTIIQTGVGGDAIVTATPVKNDEGDIDICVSNARFMDELTMLNRYYHEKESRKSRSEKKELISNDENIAALYKFANQIADSDSSVLITGETGTGKSLIAKYIHDNSSRAKSRFVEINCAAVPENLIESELFGYESGAFSGAKRGGKAGLFEIADKGTLFLDEIGDMPLNLQVKLLSVIQNKKIVRIGGVHEKKIDVRIITATNRNLEKMMDNGQFREDLYYRINVIPLYMPALRERKKDINNFICTFLDYFNKKYDKSVKIDEKIISILNRYSFPGNIRELENLIERLVVTAEGYEIKEDDIPNNIKLAVENPQEDIKVNRILPLKEALEKTEEQLVRMAFEEKGSTYKVAKLLKISQSGASRKYLKYIKDEKK